MIEPGRNADLALLDLTDHAVLPLNSAARRMLFAETGRAVRTVIVDRRLVVRGRITTLHEVAFREELAEVIREAYADYAALAARQAPAIPPLLEAKARLARTSLGLGRHIGRPEG